ncbi:N-acyl-D-amino-acid deacylase family protein [Sinomicrobium sp.]
MKGMIKQYIPVLFLALCTVMAVTAQEQPGEVDLLIKGAWVFDGSGKDSVRTNVGVTGEKISYIGTSDAVKAKKVLDAEGLYLAPGFIDTHTHADKWVVQNMGPVTPATRTNAVLPWLYQGVTTLFAGNDGFGTYKVGEKLKEYEKIGLGANFYLYVGLSSVRRAVLGSKDVDPNEEQLEAMRALVDQGMKEGAIGFSTGLLYAPQRYAETEEVIEMAKVAAKYKGSMYDTHMRSETSKLLNSIEETIRIGREAGMPVHVSHIKSAGKSNWGNSDNAIELIEKARKEGVNITANQYPFEASMTSLRANTVPGWGQSGGTKAMVKRLKDPELSQKIMDELNKRDPESGKNVIISSSRVAGLEDFNGRSLYDIGQEWDTDYGETVRRLLIMYPGLSAISFSMSEEDISNFMKEPWVMTGSDGGGAHPRTYATFTTILEEYVLEKKLFSMAWGIHRATGLTAEVFNLKDRGLIEEGRYADIIVFDPNTLKAESTFKDPAAYSKGMKYVLVNGKLAIENGSYTGVLAGKALKRQGGE